MAIFISKNAIKDLPIQQEEAYQNKGGLYSGLLSNDRYLVGMAKNNNAYRPLRKGINHSSVRTINTAFKIIRDVYENAPSFLFSASDGMDFNDSIETNVKLFQTWVGLPDNGIFDTATLLELDKRINAQAVTDELKQTYKGQLSDVIIGYSESQTAENGGTYYVTIRVIGKNDSKKVSLSQPLVGRLVNEDQNPTISPNNDSKTLINTENPEFASLSYLADLKLNTGEFYYLKDNVYFTSDSTTLDEEIDKIPFTHYDDPGTLYKVSAGEDFSNIVLQNYYNTGVTNIIDPYTDTVIFPLPNRAPFAPEKRAEDARFQFYLNLLYYSNTYEQGNNPIKEWGMKSSSSYERYSVAELDGFNIFDNNFDSGNPQSSLPNYYRFLKHMESVNPNSKLKFEPDGKCTSFEADAGKYIFIPSRQFADTLYYFLNYRSGEMLTVENADTMKQVKGAALQAIISTMRGVMDTISGLITEVKNDAEVLYEEAANYFVAAYEFALQSVVQYWPRGAGGKLGGDIDIVWGIPLGTRGTVERSLWRDMTKAEEFTICFSEKMSIGVGVEVMAGGSVGLYSGNGKNRKGLGLNLGAGAAVIPTIVASNEYTFPVRAEETAILAAMVAVFGGAMVSATAEILQFFHVINLDPRQYLTKGEITFENNIEVWAAAQAGIEQKDSNLVIQRGQTNAEQDLQKSYGFIDNILNYIPGIGGQVEGEIVAGVSLTFEAKFNKNPLIPELNTRIFSEASTNIKFFVQGELNANALGSFMQRFFITNVLPTSGFFDMFSFDQGFMLGYETKFERITPANQIILDDIQIKTTGSSLSNITELPNGDLKYSNSANDRIEKSASLYFGLFSGDVDALTHHGSEAKLKLNAGEMRKMFTQQNYVYSLDNILIALGSFSFRKKVGNFEKKSQSARKRENKFSRMPDMKYSSEVSDAFTRYGGSQVEMTLLKKLMTNAQNAIGPIVGGLALNLEIDFKFSDFPTPFLMLQFYINKLFYKYSFIQPEDYTTFENNLENQKETSLNKITQQEPNLNSVDRYAKLFANNVVYSGTPNEFDGLNKWITDLIPNNPSTDRLDAFIRFVGGIIVYSQAMDNVPPQNAQERLDTGLEDFLDIVSFITNLMNLKVSLEALFGIEVNGNIALGEGLNAKVAVGGFLHLTYNGKLYENGQLTDVGINDVMKDVLDEVERIIGLPSNGKKVGAKALFNLIKE